MTVAVRVDSSLAIGSGHLVRCLTLADALRARGERVVFVCRRLPGAMLDAPRSEGFLVLTLGEPDGVIESDTVAHAPWLGTTQACDAAETLAALAGAGVLPTWVVVDSYALDTRWEGAVRERVERIAVIDDLADRRHDADVLVDAGCSEGLEIAYRSLVPESCTLLLGPTHAFLRREFGRAVADVRIRERVERVLVFFGGADATDETMKALDGLVGEADAAGYVIDVVWGTGYARASEVVARFGSSPRVNLIGSTREMAQLMTRADLAVGGAGTSTWERCFLGLPCIVTALADNQVSLAGCVTERGAALYLGSSDRIRAVDYGRAVRELITSPERLSEMSRAALELTSDAGVARSHELVRLLIADGGHPPRYALRPLKEDDLELVRAWRNAPEVRDRMFTRHEISVAEHRTWFERIAAERFPVDVFESNGTAAGFFQLKGIDREHKECEWGFYLAPNSQNVGLGSAMCFLGAERAFDDLGLDRVFAEVSSGNEASLRLHERFGFMATDAKKPSDARASVFVLERGTWEMFRTAVARRVFEREGVPGA